MKMKEFYIQWHITNLCNLRCRHCYQDTFTKENELTWSALKNVCDEITRALRLWNCKARINFTGGEPLLKKELFNLLEYLDNNERIKELTIITNLILINPNILEKLSKIQKLKTLKFSLEGLTKNTCDALRGEGVFNKILENLELINQQKRFKTVLMFTVFKQNTREIGNLLNFSREFKVKGFIVERFIPLGRGREGFCEVLDKDNWRRLIYALLNLCQLEVDLNELIKYKAFFVDLKKNKPYLFGAPCTVARDGLCIMPNADVFPCRRFNLKIGNVLEEPLDKILSSGILQKIKKGNLKGKCKSCPVKSCRGCRALAHSLTGDYLAEDQQCYL